MTIKEDLKLINILFGLSLAFNVFLLFGYKIWIDQCKKQLEEFKNNYRDDSVCNKCK